MGLRDDSTPPVGLGEPFEIYLKSLARTEEWPYAKAIYSPIKAFPTFAEAKLYVETKMAGSFPGQHVEIRSPRDRTGAWIRYDGTARWSRPLPAPAK